MSFRFTSVLALALAAVNVAGQSLSVVNECSESVFLFTQTSFGTISNDLTVAAGATQDMGISTNWDGAINVGEYLHHRRPTWNGERPCPRANLTFLLFPGQVTYDISLIYGYNVGMEISTGDTSCDAFACTISSGCLLLSCCSSAAACAGGALPASGGGCVDNAGPGPQSPFYYTTCPNAYAFPDNDGADGFTPADEVDFTCGNTAVTLTLCPGTTSDLPCQQVTEP
ncbi:Osmotin, thaumatin-like protein [Gymnopus androsaceus JB14]|uniref:Osmotin, thaumatin-like protein n=1 Tax=Gymnopus androsaceus JB14 TaxID=1447944 RepID=A0A6A4I8F5_9AGAR|nr:Osmotin, thaumatin-like protein [Gymnopus androsaceus JB14]